MENKKECPNCVGVSEIMVPNETRGFHYENCKVCGGEGVVHPQIYDDYLFSLNEDDNTEDYDL